MVERQALTTAYDLVVVATCGGLTALAVGILFPGGPLGTVIFVVLFVLAHLMPVPGDATGRVLCSLARLPSRMAFHARRVVSPVRSRRFKARRAEARRLAAEGSAASMTVLATALADESDEVVCEIAERRLAEPAEQPAVDAAWQVWVARHGEPLLSALLAAPSSPSDSQLQVLYLFLTSRWERLEELDFDLGLLSAAYDKAHPQLRARLTAHARTCGRRDWVQVVTGDHTRRRLASIGDDEWEATIALLERDASYDELWQLTQAAPALWAARMLAALARANWRPPAHADQQDFARLLALGAKCDEPPIRPLLLHILEGQFGKRLEFEPESATPFSADGSLLATTCPVDGVVRLWRTADGGVHTTLRCDGEPLTFLGFSPDGSLIATLSHNAVRLWRTSDGALHATLETYVERLLLLAFSPDGNLIAMGTGCDNDDGSLMFERLRLWRTADGRLHATTGARRLTGPLEFSPSGDLLTCGSRTWRTADGARHREPDNAGPEGVVSPDGRLVATHHRDGRVRLWRTEDGGAYATLDCCTRPWFHEMVFSRNLRVAAGSDRTDLEHDTTPRLWRTAGGSAWQFSPDSRLLAARSATDRMRVWRIADGKTLIALGDRRIGPVRCLAFSPDGAWLAAGVGVGDRVRLWRTQDASSTIERCHPGGVSALRFSPDGAMLATGGDDGRVRLWVWCERLLRKVPADLTPGDLRMLAHLRDGKDGVAVAWLELTAALVRWHERHEITGIQVAVPSVVAGEIDIEIEGER